MASQLNWQLIILGILFYQPNASTLSGQIGRIINGIEASAKEFPYLVYLESFGNFKWAQLCGGVIISERIVLTAAHCVDQRPEAYQIYFGALNKSDPTEKGQQRLIVRQKNIVIHEEWDQDAILNDIALIKLPADLQFNDYIQPAKLPNPKESYVNLTALTSGWGAIGVDKNGKLTTPSIPSFFYSNIMSNERCSNLLHQEMPGRFFPQSWICLEPNESTPCSGDSGGPLVIENADGSSTLVGITSFVDKGCPTNSLMFFTRVSSFLEWIRKVGNTL